MVPSCLQQLAEGDGGRLGAAAEDGEVQVGGVAKVGEVDGTEGGAALENEPPQRHRPVCRLLGCPHRASFQGGYRHANVPAR